MRKHRGTFDYHDDDCRCVEAGRYCNRGGPVWSCCGACKEDAWCTAPETHPTHWHHPLHSRTIAGWHGVWPVYKSNEEIRALAPGLF